jgi:hypothetical protein
LKPDYLKLIFAGLLTVYFLWIAYDPMQGSFLDLVDLPIHETGHLVLPTLWRIPECCRRFAVPVILPAVFVGYFVWHLKYYSAAIVLFWVGQSILNVYVYAAGRSRYADRSHQRLTGSEGSFHDWNYLLTETGPDRIYQAVAGIVRGVGSLVIIAASVCSVYYSLWPSVDENQ